MIIVKYFATLRSLAGKDEDQFSMGSETTLVNLRHEMSKAVRTSGDLILGEKVMVYVN